MSNFDMQLFVLVLFLGTFAFNEERALASFMPAVALTGLQLLLVVVLPKILWGAFYWWSCTRTLHGMSRPQAHSRLRTLDRITSLYRAGILMLYLVDLVLGLLVQLGDVICPRVILIPELLVMTPPLVMLAWSWWGYYPIDRRLREALLISRIDQGLPIRPVWSRPQYMLAQLRYQVAMPLAPLILLVAMSQLIDVFVPGNLGGLPFDLRPLLQLGGAGCVFLYAPLMIRHMWDTAPLPEGELRTCLTAMCRQYHVGVRQLLIWRTYGGMVNAAVMGLVRPLRYILLSDGLLEMLAQPHVEAVMAHELAHVRHKHMLWLLASAGALMLSLSLLWTYGFILLPLQSSYLDLADTMGVVGTIVGWSLGFGWISRRFERQADTFAVQHTVRQKAFQRVDALSIGTVTGALELVAQFNHSDPIRRSWRHGSIRWRQYYLQSLLSMDVDHVPIDRQIVWIKRITSVALGCELIWLIAFASH